MVNPKLKNLYLDSDTVLDNGDTDSSEDDSQPQTKRPPVEPTEESVFEEPVEVAETPEDENPVNNQGEQGW